MLKAIAEKIKGKKSKKPTTGKKKVQININQYELAIINRILKNPDNRFKHSGANVGKNPRILKIQKKNLESLCKSLGVEYRESELERLLSSLEDLDFLSFHGFD